MGTRTWSRKGVLTAAGKRRQASLGVGQSVLDVSFDEPSALAPNPISASILAKGGPFETLLRERLIAAALSGNSVNNFRTDTTTADIVTALQDAPLDQLLTMYNEQIPQTVLYELIGFNAPPTIESWDDVEEGVGIEKAPNGESLMGYRGVFSSRNMSAKDVTNALRNGPIHYVGKGGTGYGTYIALAPYSMQVEVRHPFRGNQIEIPNREERRALAYQHAKSYILDAEEDGLITAIGIKAGARTNMDELNRIPPDSAARSSAHIWADRIKKEFTKRYGITLNTSMPYTGFIAAALGYDAYVGIGNGSQYTNEGWNHTVILNRGKMVVSSNDQLEEY